MGKVLIIEDDPYVRKFYERLALFNKYNVELAANGTEGIEKAKSLKPTLIFLDIMMPEMSGLEVLRRLKNDPETKDIAVIMLTNYGDSETVKEAASLGAGGFIIKSNIEPEQLGKEIERYLQN